LKFYRASICKQQLDAVEIFEHQNNRQIKSNAAVRKPSLAEQHRMRRIFRQERWGGGLVEELIYQKKKQK
jgi:hypothetical protein